MAFFHHHPNFKHCDIRRTPRADWDDDWLERSKPWTFWPANDELPPGVHMAFFDEFDGKRAPVLAMASGCTVRIFEFSCFHQLENDDDLWQKVISSLLAIDDLPKQYFERFWFAMLSFGVLEPARRYEAARAIMKFCEDTIRSVSHPC